MSDFPEIRPESPLLDDDIKKQLAGVFERLAGDVKLVSIIDKNNPKCLELGCFLATIAEMTPKVKVEFLALGENSEKEAELKAEHLPVVGFYRGEKYAKVAFHGVPGGKELNSFVLAVYNVGGPGQKIEDKQRNQILAFEGKADIKIFVSLACHHCADTVTAAQLIASLNPNVEAIMYDAQLFPDIIQKYEISRVPMTVVNEKKYLGGKDLQAIIDML